MTIYRALMGLILTLVLSACGGGDSSEGQNGAPSTDELNARQLRLLEQAHKPVDLRWSDLEAAKSYFQFENPEAPLSVGQMVSHSRTTRQGRQAIETGNCQGSMISSDYFVTSRHCIPKDILARRSNCNGRIKIILPEIGDKPYRSLNCEKVMAFAPYHPSLRDEVPQPDWAVIKIKGTVKDRSYRPDFSGVMDRERLFGFLPLTDPKTHKINLKQITCQAIQRNWLVPEYIHSRSPLVFLQCDHGVTKGFSGLTLFRHTDAGGFVPVSVLSHIRAEQINNEKLLISPFVVASNMSCLPFQSNGQLPPACRFNPNNVNLLKKEIIVGELTDLKKKVDEEMQPWIDSPEDPVVWSRIDESKWNKLPPTYQAKFNEERARGVEFLPGESQDYFTQTTVPIYAKCIRTKFLPDQGQITQIPTKVPVVEVSVLRTDTSEITSQYQVREIPAEVRKGPGDGYVLKQTSSYPGFLAPQRMIIGGYFTHASVTIPPCPEGV